MYRGLFSEMGAMVNHSSRPNLLFKGSTVASHHESFEELVLVLQAVRDIQPGEELTITYLGDLYLPFPERDQRLQELYGFGSDRLSSDSGLEAVIARPPEEIA